MDDYDQLFEFEYQDDLDALEDLENESKLLESIHCKRGKRSLDFIATNLHDNLETGNKSVAQLVPRGEDLDVSFVVPLDQSIDKSTEDEPRKQSVATDLRIFGDRLDVTEKEQSDQLNDVVLLRGCNNGNSEVRKRNYPEELPKTASWGTSLKKVRKNEVLETENAAETLISARSAVLTNPSRVSRRIPQGDFMAVTGTDGRRLYMSVKSDSFMKHQVAQVSSDHKCLQLLGAPLATLKAQMEEDNRMHIVRRAAQVQHAIELNNMEDMDIGEDHHSLLVDRYAPKKYTDLLSEESTNRSLLRWLKLWDFAVFGIQTKTVIAKAEDAKVKRKEPFGSNKPFPDKKLTDGNQDELLDKQNRPIFKVALVSGPPGLGKTTLAHIVARHAGYNVVEMNASDDRSPDVFRERIEAATQMKAMLGADPRPNCLIIDEIDGAPQPAINVLLSVIKSTDAPASDTGASRKKRGHNAVGVLQRPIICICNDLYVPALRQLRQSAYIVTFHSTSAPALASRLLEVAKMEHIHTDLTALLALCEKADNDIRSCLNTLQFVKAQKSELSLNNVQSLSLGQKDTHKTLFTVWQHIFTVPKAKRKRYINPHDRVGGAEQADELRSIAEESNTTFSSRFSQTLQIVSAAGDDQKVQQGLFENYLEAKVKDPRLDKLQSAAGWFCFVDLLNESIGRAQNYSLYRYLPFLPVTLHLLFASNHPHKIVYPHTQFEIHTKCSKSENLIGTLLADVTPSVRSRLNRNIIVLELLPLLVDIMQPTLRPVNTQLYNAREKADLAHLVDVMISYNLTYQQTRAVDGQYTYVLEPDVDQLVRFPGIKAQRVMSYGAKQLITREVDLEKLRRTEASFAKKFGKSQITPSAPKVDVSAKSVEVLNKVVQNDPIKEPTDGKALEVIPNHRRQFLQPKSLSISEIKPVLDFFGRQIVKQQLPESGEEKKETVEKEMTTGTDIWFKFKEGYTNAVRKTVRVQDFL